jgi:anti-anti-sigma factor
MLSVTSSQRTGRDGTALLVVHVEGDITLSTLPRLTDALHRDTARAEVALVVVDLDAVDLIDDAGLGALMGFAARMRASQRGVAVVASMPRVRERLADSRFDRAVDVVSSVGDAERFAR